MIYGKLIQPKPKWLRCAMSFDRELHQASSGTVAVNGTTWSIVVDDYTQSLGYEPRIYYDLDPVIGEGERFKGGVDLEVISGTLKMYGLFGPLGYDRFYSYLIVGIGTYHLPFEGVVPTGITKYEYVIYTNGGYSNFEAVFSNMFVYKSN